MQSEVGRGTDQQHNDGTQIMKKEYNKYKWEKPYEKLINRTNIVMGLCVLKKSQIICPQK